MGVDHADGRARRPGARNHLAASWLPANVGRRRRRTGAELRGERRGFCTNHYHHCREAIRYRALLWPRDPQCLFDDVALLADIERAAGAAFRDVGMAAIADDEPLPVSDLLGYQRAGRAWVATDDVDRPVAYLLLDVVDDCAHIEQVSVHPGHAHLGLGRALLDTAATWAQLRGLPALTLTTFTDVPWNAPYYARLGFRLIRPDLLSPGLRRIREHEAAIGLDAWPRGAMHRPVSATSPVR